MLKDIKFCLVQKHNNGVSEWLCIIHTFISIPFCCHLVKNIHHNAKYIISWLFKRYSIHESAITHIPDNIFTLHNLLDSFYLFDIFVLHYGSISPEITINQVVNMNYLLLKWQEYNFWTCFFKVAGVLSLCDICCYYNHIDYISKLSKYCQGFQTWTHVDLIMQQLYTFRQHNNLNCHTWQISLQLNYFTIPYCMSTTQQLSMHE